MTHSFGSLRFSGKESVFAKTPSVDEEGVLLGSVEGFSYSSYGRVVKKGFSGPEIGMEHFGSDVHVSCPPGRRGGVYGCEGTGR